MKKMNEEFAFLRDRLKDIAILLLSDETNKKTEAAFMIGCLHSICHGHSVEFSKNEENKL